MSIAIITIQLSIMLLQNSNNYNNFFTTPSVEEGGAILEDVNDRADCEVIISCEGVIGKSVL